MKTLLVERGKGDQLMQESKQISPQQELSGLLMFTHGTPPESIVFAEDLPKVFNRARAKAFLKRHGFSGDTIDDILHRAYSK